MNPWYERLVEEQYQRHDQQCAYGKDCLDREGHVHHGYIPRALKAKVEQMSVQHAAAERRGAEKAIRHAAKLTQRSFTGEVHYEQLNEHADMIRDGEVNPFEADQEDQ